jgi:ribosomal protein S18 acetylase RimI-like enzyme
MTLRRLKVSKFDWRQATGACTGIDPFETGCRDFRAISLTANVEDYSLLVYAWYGHQWQPFCFTATDCDNASGFVLGHIEGAKNHQGHVMALAIASSSQRSGMGTALMGELEQSFKSKGVRFIDLMVRQSNRQAITFYKKRGYVVYSSVLRYYEDEDAFNMRKSLVTDSNECIYTSPPLLLPIFESAYDQYVPPEAQAVIRGLTGVGIGYLFLTAFLSAMHR